jgi:hypothetical protein
MRIQWAGSESHASALAAASAALIGALTAVTAAPGTDCTPLM